MKSPRCDRLLLRRWQPSDREPFAELNADPEVTEFLAGPLSISQSNLLAGKIEQHFDKHDFGLWAVEVLGEVSFAGFVGLFIPNFTSHFTPCIEIGWRLARGAWGKGYATEGAKAVLQFGVEQLGINEIVSFTTIKNTRSRRVMEKIGLTHNPEDDFDHPNLPSNHPLLRHVLYRRGQSKVPE